MPRQLSFGDWRSYRAVQRLASGLGVDVLHGHGAKGGAYARLAARGLKRGQKRVAAFYSPHRGSTHSPPATLMGRVYAEAERRLAPFTDGIMFESRFAARRYQEVIGAPPVGSVSSGTGSIVTISISQPSSRMPPTSFSSANSRSQTGSTSCLRRSPHNARSTPPGS